jgi:hypothetical protein
MAEPQVDPTPAPRVRPSRRSLATCEVLRGLAYSAARSACPPRRANAFGARARDDDDLVVDSLHESFAFQSLPFKGFVA